MPTREEAADPYRYFYNLNDRALCAPVVRIPRGCTFYMELDCSTQRTGLVGQFFACKERKSVDQPRQPHLHGMSPLYTWFSGIDLRPLARLPLDRLEECIYTPLHKDRNELAMAQVSYSIWMP